MIETFLHIHRAMVAQAAREGAELGARRAALRASLRGTTPDIGHGTGHYTAEGYQTWWRAGDVVGSNAIGP